MIIKRFEIPRVDASRMSVSSTIDVSRASSSTTEAHISLASPPTAIFSAEALHSYLDHERDAHLTGLREESELPASIQALLN